MGSSALEGASPTCDVSVTTRKKNTHLSQRCFGKYIHWKEVSKKAKDSCFLCRQQRRCSKVFVVYESLNPKLSCFPKMKSGRDIVERFFVLWTSRGLPKIEMELGISLLMGHDKEYPKTKKGIRRIGILRIFQFEKHFFFLDFSFLQLAVPGRVIFDKQKGLLLGKIFWKN